jgi:hypothetical protein
LPDDVRDNLAEEHGELALSFGAAHREIESGDVLRARAALAMLRRDLDSHCEQEARLHFPVVASLRPERRDALQALVAAHDALGARAAELDRHLAGAGDLGAARTALEALEEALERHEREEEALIVDLEREGGPSA